MGTGASCLANIRAAQHRHIQWKAAVRPPKHERKARRLQPVKERKARRRRLTSRGLASKARRCDAVVSHLSCCPAIRVPHAMRRRRRRRPTQLRVYDHEPCHSIPNSLSNRCRATADRLDLWLLFCVVLDWWSSSAIRGAEGPAGRTRVLVEQCSERALAAAALLRCCVARGGGALGQPCAGHAGLAASSARRRRHADPSLHPRRCLDTEEWARR